MLRRIKRLGWLVGFAFLSFIAAAPAAETTGPWNLGEIKQPFEATWGEEKEGVQEVYYPGEPFEGHSTRVFAYYARPQEGDGPFPAMLLIHGGGGKAFAEWAKQWAQRGYAALAMDLGGHGPDGERLADAGPEQDDRTKFRAFSEEEASQMWSYHAVAAVVRGASLLAAREEVDGDRIGATGIDWGGYLVCIVAGLDDRLKAAVPVYGCGFLSDDSVWKPTFERMPADLRERWVKNFDPSNYLPSVRCPMLFINGTNDFAYPLGSFQKSYQLVPGPVDLCLRVRIPHSQPDGWASVETGIFVDGLLNDGRPLAAIEPAEIHGNRAVARFKTSVPIHRSEAHFAIADGPWGKRGWQSVSAVHTRDTVSAELPTARPLAYYLSITDERGALVSTPLVVLEDD